ncbi:MAG: Uma2 family endonuclease [Gemmataceae bacterium]|nr:Uma2 family endonuclease [Gemmataceae bacterium]
MQQLYDFDEFCVLVADGRKADLIDGVIYMASPENIGHCDLRAWLLYLIRRYLKHRKIGGKLLDSRVAFRLTPRNSPEPDIGYLTPSRAHLAQRGFVDGRPDLAIEIVSPDSVARDYNEKKLQYLAAAVPEYWIIDPLTSKMTCWRRTEHGDYRRLGKGGRVESEVIPGFWLRAAWLFQSPLPDEDEILSEISGISPKGART